VFDDAFGKRAALSSKYRLKDARSGEYRWMFDQAHPVFNPDFKGYIGSMTDIHQQELAHIAMQELIAKKNEFLSIASHELKTPVTTIKASLQVLERMLGQETDTTQALPIAARASKQVDKLMTIVRDLLDISRIQSGKLVLNKGEYLFSESLMECITDLRKQRPEVMIEVDEIPPLKLNADRIRVEQVIVNLLSNAVKYSPFEKKIKIMAAVVDQMLRVSVTDEGIGIPAEKQASFCPCA
jgi:signal transduction histidine kinase